MMDKLWGETVRLVPVREEHHRYFADLKNDFRTQGWSQRQAPTWTAERIAEGIRKSKNQKHGGILAIETLDGTLAGNINFHEDSPRFSATIGIITGMEHWGKPYVREAQELILKYLFVERGVQVVRLWTQSGNVRAVAAAGKLGFKVAGKTRHGCLMGGISTDNLCMDIVREEYFKRRGMEDPHPWTKGKG